MNIFAPAESVPGHLPNETSVCDAQLNYSVILNNPDAYNFCLVPDGGADAIFFAGLAILVICVASPRWDAIIVLFGGALYQGLVYSYPATFGHITNGSSLWLGMRPADIFVFVFLPPFLLDLAVRLDFFMLKKMILGILYMAFVMVISSALILIPFMLWGLGLSSNGWTAADVALFGATIASTDAMAVSAVLTAGGAPEVLSLILEGESLFNDASSLTLFEIFEELIRSHHDVGLGDQIAQIVVKTIWSAFTGICVGLAMGVFNQVIFIWLQHRNMASKAEVAFSVGSCYLAFYITQVWCLGSGCIGAAVYGLYGSATLLWGMSNKARATQIFQQFWDVFSFLINGLIFFYVGASCVNFTVRAGDQLYDHGISELLKDTLYRLPLIWLFSFALRGIFLFIGFKFFDICKLSDKINTRQVVFITVGGLRGSLSLVLAAAVAAEGASDHDESRKRVRAEMSIYIAGYVILTLLVNAPCCGPLLTLLKLDHVSEEALQMRKHVKELFRHYGSQCLNELQQQQDEDDMLQGVDWTMVEELTDTTAKLEKALPEHQPRLDWLGWLQWFRWVKWLNPVPVYQGLTDSCRKESEVLDEVQIEEKEKKKTVKQDLRRSTVGMARMEAGGGRSLASMSQAPLPSGHLPASESSVLFLGVSGLFKGSSRPLDRGSSHGRSPRAASRGVSEITPSPTSPAEGGDQDRPSRASGRPSGGRQALYTWFAGLAKPQSNFARSMNASAGAAVAAHLRPAAAPAVARPSMASRPSAWSKNRSRSGRLHYPAPPPAPPAPPPAPPPPMPRITEHVPTHGASTAGATNAPGGSANVAVEHSGEGSVAEVGKAGEVAMIGGPPLVAPPGNGAGVEAVRTDSGSVSVSAAGPQSGHTSSAAAQDAGSSSMLAASSVGASAAARAPMSPLGRDSSSAALQRRSQEMHDGDDAILAAVHTTGPNAGPPANHAAAGRINDGNVSVPPPPAMERSAGPIRHARASSLPEAAPSEPAAPGTEHTAAARVGSGGAAGAGAGEGGQQGPAWKPKPFNPMLVIKAHGPTTSQQALPMSSAAGTAESSELTQMSNAGVRFVQRQSRVDGNSYVEAIHTGKVLDRASAALATTSRGPAATSKGLSTASRPLGRGSVGNKVLSTAAIAALEAASVVAPGANLATTSRRGEAYFESPPGHEFDGVGGGRPESSRFGPAAGERPLHTRSTAVPGSAGTWSGGGKGKGRESTFSRPLGRGSTGASYGAPIARGSVGHVFESPPGHEGDGLDAHTPHEGSAGRQTLGTRSTGFPGYGPILGAHEASMQRPMGASKPPRATYNFESPPGHEFDGFRGRRSVELPLHRSSAGYPGAGSQEVHPTSPPPPERTLATCSVGTAHMLAGAGAAAFGARAAPGASSSGARLRQQSLGTMSVGAAHALGTVSEHQDPCAGGLAGQDEEKGMKRGDGALAVISAPVKAFSARAGLSKLLGGLGSKLGLTASSSSPDLVAGGREDEAATGAAGGGAAAAGAAISHMITASTLGGAASVHAEEEGVASVYTERGTTTQGTPFGVGSDAGGGAGGGKGFMISSGFEGGSGEEGGEEAAVAQREQEHMIHQMLPECRMRLLTGLKQYYKDKYEASVLGAQAFKTLSYCCDSAHHHAHAAMELWQRVQQEVGTGKGFINAEVKLYYQLKAVDSRLKAKPIHPGFRAKVTSWLRQATAYLFLSLPTWLLSKHLNNVMMVSLETAVELWISLTDSMQTQWLSYTGSFGELVLGEVQESAEQAWDFIIDRRVEIPEIFQAIQTHRATIQLLSQQRTFVHQMAAGGLFEDREAVRMLDVVDRRLQRVRRNGPQWRAQTLTQILANTYLLRNVSPKVIEWIKRNSVIKMYKQGELIWQRGDASGRDGSGAVSGELPGVFIVISGVARIVFEMEGGSVPMHLGSGGLCGLLSTVLESEAPGMTMTALYAEGHALGEGPVVLHMPLKLINIIRHFSREERLPTYQQLELQMLRTAANNVVDLLHEQVSNHLGAFIRGAMQYIVCTGMRGASQLARRQRLRALLHERDLGELEGGFDWISELLALPPQVAYALLEHGEDSRGHDEQSGLPMVVEGLEPQVWHEQMFKAIVAANRVVYELVRAAVKESVAVVLGPGKVVMQQCTMVLVQGSLMAAAADEAPSEAHMDEGHGLRRRSSGSSGGGHERGSHRHSPLPSQAIRRAQTIISRNDDHVAPSVMIWTPDYFGEELAKQAPIRVQAGDKGATLMVLGDVAPLLQFVENAK